MHADQAARVEGLYPGSKEAEENAGLPIALADGKPDDVCRLSHTIKMLQHTTVTACNTARGALLLALQVIVLKDSRTCVWIRSGFYV